MHVVNMLVIHPWPSTRTREPGPLVAVIRAGVVFISVADASFGAGLAGDGREPVVYAGVVVHGAEPFEEGAPGFSRWERV